MLVLKLSCLWT